MNNEPSIEELKDELYGLRSRSAVFATGRLTTAQLCERDQVFRRIREIKRELGCD